MLIDSHCHLYMGDGSNDIGSVINRAKEMGVGKMICPGINIKTSLQAVKIAMDNKEVFAAAGIHPHDVDDLPLDFIQQLKEILVKPQIAALGEIGLDYYRNYSDVDKQRKVFKQQLLIAKELDLPVIIHNRNADSDIIKILKDVGKVRGVAHCFSSDLETATNLIDMGLYISFAGNITYKNSDLPEVAKGISLDKLLIETDAPFLSPMPYRGKENEPSRLKLIAEKVAEICCISFNEIESATLKNTEKLFNLPKS